MSVTNQARYSIDKVKSAGKRARTLPDLAFMIQVNGWIYLTGFLDSNQRQFRVNRSPESRNRRNSRKKRPKTSAKAVGKKPSPESQPREEQSQIMAGVALLDDLQSTEVAEDGVCDL